MLDNRGASIIDIILTMSIIGILIGIGSLSFGFFKNRAEDLNVELNCKAIRESVVSEYSFGGLKNEIIDNSKITSSGGDLYRNNNKITLKDEELYMIESNSYILDGISHMGSFFYDENFNIYYLSANPNIGSLNNPKSWSKTKLTVSDDVIIVDSNNSPGGYGVISDRDIGVDIKKDERYKVSFDIRSENISYLRYNYIISDLGNKKLPNIKLNKKNEWESISIIIESKDKDMINAGILIGGDLRSEPKGTKFEIKNLVIQKDI